jgi:hypothetical protein
MTTSLSLQIVAASLLLALAACDDPSHGLGTVDASDDATRPRRDVSDDSQTGDADLDIDDIGEGSDAQIVDDADSDGSAADADVGPDSADVAGDPDAADTIDVAETVDCGVAPALYTGVHAVDVNGDPLEVGDSIAFRVEVLGVAGGAVTLDVVGTNLEIDAASITLDAVSTDAATVDEGRLRLDLDPGEPAIVEFDAAVVATTALVVLFAQLDRLDGVCPVPRSRSGAILQVIGGSTKTPLCLDMREVRSVQVAPEVALQNTATYAAENGRRTDLRAENFIFCPQSPTIVHETEFCLEREPGQSISLAGSYRADSYWEVDDFMLFEVLSLAGDDLLDDGFTSQQHPGGSTFWCGEIAQLMCTTACTAALVEIAESRDIEAIAVAPATGATARRHDDGDVDIAPLLPADGSRVDLRITALDQGVEGTLRPGLYLVSDEP